MEDRLQLEEENQSMLSFIGQTHNDVHAARAEKDQIACELAQIEAYSLAAEGNLASLCTQVDSLWGELASSIADADHYYQEVLAIRRDWEDFAIHLSQAEVAVKERDNLVALVEAIVKEQDNLAIQIEAIVKNEMTWLFG